MSVNDLRPKTLHWKVRPGDATFKFTAEFFDGTTPLNISAWTFELSIARRNGTEVENLTLGDGISSLSTSKIQVELTGAQVTALPQEVDLDYTFQATTDTAQVYTLLVGRIISTLSGGDCCDHGDTNLTYAINGTLNFEFSSAVGGPPILYSLAVVNGTTYAITAGTVLHGFAVDSTGSARTLTVGTSSGGTQILDAEEIEANDAPYITRGRYFQSGATLHFSGFTGNLKLILFKTQ